MPHDRDRAATRLIRSPLPLQPSQPTVPIPVAAQAALVRLDAASAELAAELAASRQTTEQVQRFADDVDSDKISTDGMVVEPFEEEDTVVRHIRSALDSLAG